jgi:hypothetical protein
MFANLADVRDDLSSRDRRDFREIKNNLAYLMNVKASIQYRIKAWQDAVKEGKIYNNGPETIPDYDPTLWHKDREGLKYLVDSAEATKEIIFRFYQAASFHRNYILRTLLPKYNLVVH